MSKGIQLKMRLFVLYFWSILLWTETWGVSDHRRPNPYRSRGASLLANSRGQALPAFFDELTPARPLHLRKQRQFQVSEPLVQSSDVIPVVQVKTLPPLSSISKSRKTFHPTYGPQTRQQALQQEAERFMQEHPVPSNSQYQLSPTASTPLETKPPTSFARFTQFGKNMFRFDPVQDPAILSSIPAVPRHPRLESRPAVPLTPEPVVQETVPSAPVVRSRFLLPRSRKPFFSSPTTEQSTPSSLFDLVSQSTTTTEVPSSTPESPFTIVRLRQGTNGIRTTERTFTPSRNNRARQQFTTATPQSFGSSTASSNRVLKRFKATPTSSPSTEPTTTSTVRTTLKAVEVEPSSTRFEKPR